MASEEKSDQPQAACQEEAANDKDENLEGTTPNDLSHKVSEGANYLGSILNSAWSKTAKTANEAASSTFLSFGKGEKAADQPSGEPEKSQKTGDVAEESGSKLGNEGAEKSDSASAFFSNAWSKVGALTKSASANFKQGEEPQKGGENEAGGNFFGSLSGAVGKMANDASSVIKDSVNTSFMADFDKEQKEFIRNKRSQDMEGGVAPWIGYKDEEDLKAKILLLSEEKRNFIRSPPSGVTFDFDYTSVSSTAMALLATDPNLEKMRYQLVPKIVKEDDFWRNYFYRISLIKQSFDLKDLEESGGQKSAESRLTGAGKAAKPDIQTSEDDVNNPASADHDDEFVSDSYQASSEDINEANESMKRLGVQGKKKEEWEAELEGELNEFEVVSSKDGREEDSEIDEQIQQMLDDEENNK